MEARFLWQSGVDVGAEFTEDEKWCMIRECRNRALSYSDWTQLADAPLTDQEQIEAWRIYRQALREMPENYLTADEAIFPTPPEGELV
jgi:hypothetical protein